MYPCFGPSDTSILTFAFILNNVPTYVAFKLSSSYELL